MLRASERERETMENVHGSVNLVDLTCMGGVHEKTDIWLQL